MPTVNILLHLKVAMACFYIELVLATFSAVGGTVIRWDCTLLVV